MHTQIVSNGAETISPENTAAAAGAAGCVEVRQLGCTQSAVVAAGVGICCNILQHTATHCNTLQHTAAYCNILQHAATHCNILQHTATYCNVRDVLQHMRIVSRCCCRCGNILQRTATYCNVCDLLQHMRIISRECYRRGGVLQYTATHCNMLQHTATYVMYCNICA